MKKKNNSKLPIQREQVEMEAGIIFSYTISGKAKIENIENIEDGLKANIPMTVRQACREFNINPITYYSHLNKFPEVKKRYELMRENRREYIKGLAEDNILEVLEGKELVGKEKFDANFKFLQATEKAYNPKLEIETKNFNINISKSTDDLIAEINSLLHGEKINNNE